MVFSYTHNGVLLKQKILNLAICNNMDETWEYFGQWNKSEKEKISLSHLYVEYKRQKITEQSETILRNTENKQVVAWGEGCRGYV